MSTSCDHDPLSRIEVCKPCLDAMEQGALAKIATLRAESKRLREALTHLAQNGNQIAARALLQIPESNPRFGVTGDNVMGNPPEKNP